MPFQNVLTDLFTLVTEFKPLPDIKSRASVKEFIARIYPTIVDAIYDAGGLAAVNREVGAMDTNALIALACAAEPEKFGDGTLLKLFLEALPGLLAVISQFINGWKQIQPAPTPTPTPAPGPVVGH